MEFTQQEADDVKSNLQVKDVGETCSVLWTIPNWKEVRMNKASVNGQKVTVESRRCGKWIIGLKSVRTSLDYRARVYCKLVKIYGFSEQLEVTVCKDVLCAQGGVAKSVQTTRTLAVNETIEENDELLNILSTYSFDDPFIHSDGSVKYSLKLITKVPDSNKRELDTEEFSRKSVKKLCDNQASLLTDDVNADLKIVARDGTEIRAHKTILMAQCPVFAGMLATDFREVTSGFIKLDDISGKTMKILLHYFYTGSLLLTWSDEDIIVEFVYAAGKYQIDLVLDLLDSTLGREKQRDTCYVDVQLLNLTDKLSLKGAEGRLLQRVVERIKNVEEIKDLFELFGYDNEDIAKMANLMCSEIIGESNVWEILDTLLRDHEDSEQEKEMGKMGFQVLAVVQRKNENGKLETLKKLILNWYGKTVAKFTSANELFNFFGHENL